LFFKKMFANVKSDYVSPPPLPPAEGKLKPVTLSKRGLSLEPVARALYERRTNRSWQPKKIECPNPSLSWLVGRADGYNEELNVYCEIKCGNLAEHLEVSKGTIPERYMVQLQCMLLITGTEYIDYVSYNPEAGPGRELHVVKVLPDSSFIVFELLPKLIEFYRCMVFSVPPPK